MAQLLHLTLKRLGGQACRKARQPASAPTSKIGSRAIHALYREVVQIDLQQMLWQSMQPKMMHHGNMFGCWRHHPGVPLCGRVSHLNGCRHLPAPGRALHLFVHC